MDSSTESERMAGVKRTTFKYRAQQFALFDQEAMDGDIVYLPFDVGTDGLHEAEVLRQVNASSKTFVNEAPRLQTQGFRVFVR